MLRMVCLLALWRATRHGCRARQHPACAVEALWGAWGELAAVVSWAPEGHVAGLWGQTGPTGRCPRPDTDGNQEVDL
jgi:hypothetical protein